MIVVCLANVRSGTTALARCFRGSEAFVNLGEVFYSSEDGTGHYVGRWETPHPPSISRFEEYLGFLRNDLDHLYWLDIKFHDLGRFNPPQYGVLDPPRMLLKILEAGDPLLLLNRANCLRGACSGLQASATGNFHLENGKAGEERAERTPQDRLATIHAIRQAQSRKKQFLAVERHLLTHPNLFLADYEAVFDREGGAKNRAALGRWMGVDVVSDPDLQKIADDWPSWFDVQLARDILKGTGDQWWVA